MAYQLELRRDTAANWTSVNPTLAQGEFGFETDTKKIKIGDGSTTWTSLLYYASPSSSAVTTQAGTTYTLALADAGSYIRFSNAAAITATVPPNSSVGFAIGAEITIEQTGAGALSVAAGAGVTINSRGADLTLAGQFSVASLKKVATDTWTLTGDL